LPISPLASTGWTNELPTVVIFKDDALGAVCELPKAEDPLVHAYSF